MKEATAADVAVVQACPDTAQGNKHLLEAAAAKPGKTTRALTGGGRETNSHRDVSV